MTKAQLMTKEQHHWDIWIADDGVLGTSFAGLNPPILSSCMMRQIHLMSSYVIVTALFSPVATTLPVRRIAR